jgi:hypothetical protein
MQPHHHVGRVTRMHCNLFLVRNVSYGGHLLVLSAWFILCSTSVLAALPHLHKVVNLGHSVQFPFLRLFLHFQVVFCFHCIQFGVSAWKNPVIGWRKLPYNDFFAKGLACGLWLPSADNISAKGKSGLHSDNMCCVREYVVCPIGEMGVLSMRVIRLSPPVGSVWYPKCSANLQWVRVVIIEIWIDLPPVIWCFRRQIQIEPDGGQ